MARALLNAAGAVLSSPRSGHPEWGKPVNWLVRIFGKPRSDLAEAAVSALLRLWVQLPVELRDDAVALVAGREELIGRLLDGAAAGETLVRRSAAAAIGDLQNPELGRSLSRLIADVDEVVAQSAESAAIRLAGAPSSDEALEHCLAPLVSAFAAHRRRGVMVAASIALDPGRLARSEGPLVRWFSGGGHESHMAFRSVVRRSTEPLLRLRAWQWLGRRDTPVAAAALDRVASGHGPEDHEAVLAASHLCANPGRARRAALITAKRPTTRARPGTGRALPSRDEIPRLSARARRGLPRFAASLRIEPEALNEAIEPLLADTDPLARLAGSRVAVGSGVLDYCFDRDEKIARGAALRLAGPGTGAPEVWERVRRSTHPIVRMIAEQERSRSDPWNAAIPGSRLTARRMLAADAEGFLAMLRSRVKSGEAASRVGAIQMARRLGLAAPLELELLAAIRSEGTSGAVDDPVAPTAVTALAGVNTPSAEAAIRACMEHPADRVRANAVEAASRRRGPDEAQARALYGALVELKSDPHHRVRANALRGLFLGAGARLYEPAAVEGLASMLGDERSMHRLAGLWVAERVLSAGSVFRGWNELASRVARLAGDTSDPEVQTRATRCARRLLTEMRSEWRARAAAAERQEDER